MRKAGEDVSDQHQKDFDMDMLLEEQDFRSVGIKCLDMNDYQVEYAGQGVATRPVKVSPHTQERGSDTSISERVTALRAAQNYRLDS